MKKLLIKCLSASVVFVLFFASSGFAKKLDLMSIKMCSVESNRAALLMKVENNELILTINGTPLKMKITKVSEIPKTGLANDSEYIGKKLTTGTVYLVSGIDNGDGGDTMAFALYTAEDADTILVQISQVSSIMGASSLCKK